MGTSWRNEPPADQRAWRALPPDDPGPEPVLGGAWLVIVVTAILDPFVDVAGRCRRGPSSSADRSRAHRPVQPEVVAAMVRNWRSALRSIWAHQNIEWGS